MTLPAKIIDGYEQPLENQGCLPDSVHVFEQDVIDAIHAAMAARRPLLVRGEPGTGKSQIARAAAAAMDRALIITVTDARTETRDLLWSLDAVARLAEAQLMGCLHAEQAETIKERLALRRFVQPGALWWAFDWATAETQAQESGEGPCVRVVPSGWTPPQGTVVLVDEIDKADSSVPNGLLDALGHRSFGTPWGDPVSMSDATPLVLITTNEERTLPDAFLRRCFVLQLHLPIKGQELTDRLVRYGRAHFPQERFPKCDDQLLLKAAKLVERDRIAVSERSLCPPGLAEYIDLLQAVTSLGDERRSSLEWLKKVSPFVLRKHPDDPA